MTTAGKDPGGHRYAAADAELSGYFTAAVGVRAQSYQGAGGAFESDALHEQRLKAMRAGGMAWFDRVAATLAQLPTETQRTLALLYAPHGWDDNIVKAFEEDLPTKPACWPLGVPWAPLPTWRTSLVAVALRLPEATAASGTTDAAATADWLLERQARIARIESRADRAAAQGKHDSLIKRLMREAIAVRSRVVAEYEAVRAPLARSIADAEWAAKSPDEKRRARMSQRDDDDQAALREAQARRVAVALEDKRTPSLEDVCEAVAAAKEAGLLGRAA